MIPQGRKVGDVSLLRPSSEQGCEHLSEIRRRGWLHWERFVNYELPQMERRQHREFPPWFSEHPCESDIIITNEKKKKMTSSPEGSHPKLQSIWVLVQNLNSQMPVVADRWQKFVSQERCNTKGGVTQREEVAWIGNHWPCLVILSFKCLGTQRKQTNKQMTPPLPVSDPFPGILFHLCVPITKPIPSCISAKQNHVIMSTIEGNTRSGLWSKIAMD